MNLWVQGQSGLQSEFQPSLGSEEKREKQKADEDTIKQKALVPAPAAIELGSFGHMILPLESKIEERGYEISLHD